MTALALILSQDAPEASELGWSAVIGGAAGLCAVLAFLATVLRLFWVKLAKPVGEFLDDWRGENARPGYAGRPGVPARLSKIEGRLSRVEAEITADGGNSMKDHVSKLARRAGVE